MSAWVGWAKDVLAKIGAPETDANRRFLVEWEQSEATTCAFNPISVRSIQPGSVRCHDLGNGYYARAYTTKAIGLAATVEQLHNVHYAAILAALKTGDPFSVSVPDAVENQLNVWAAHKYAAKYAAEIPTPPPGSGTTDRYGYLKGGPCDGTRHKLNTNEEDTATVICKESRYTVDSPPQHHNGDLVFTYRGKVPPPKPPPKIKAGSVHKGYADIRHSVNAVMPVSLRNAQRSTKAALRTLARAHKVRIR